MNADEQMYLLDNLEISLEKQIEMARKSNFRQVEALAEQANSIIEKIVKIKPFGPPEFDGRRKHLLGLYKKLELMLAAGKDSVAKQLRQAGNARKTLKAYRNNG